MLVPTILAAAAALGANATREPPRMARAQVAAFVRIIQAAEIRDGHTDVPHRRRIAIDTDGTRRILIEFE